MRKSKYSHLFKKQLKKIKGKELSNVLRKRDEILISEDLNHYKNLKHNLKKYKRVHVNNSYIILFFGDDDFVYFVDYAHHDIVYKQGKKFIKKYNNLEFSS